MQAEVFEDPVRVREMDLVFGGDEPSHAQPAAKTREMDLVFSEEEPSAKKANPAQLCSPNHFACRFGAALQRDLDPSWSARATWPRAPRESARLGSLSNSEMSGDQFGRLLHEPLDRWNH